MNRTIQILYVILIFSLLPRVGNAQCSRTMPVEKIEICSIGKVFTPIQLSRFSWVELWKSKGCIKRYITDKKDIDWIICNLEQSYKIEDLDYDVYSPAVKEVDVIGFIEYRPITPEIRGIMLLYVQNNPLPEIIWLNISTFDRKSERYQLSDDFWEYIHVL